MTDGRVQTPAAPFGRVENKRAWCRREAKKKDQSEKGALKERKTVAGWRVMAMATILL